MTRRKKIIFFTILAILILAIIWFLYEKNQQSKNVESGTGNVSSLFPFTGTNTTNFQKEGNSGLPQNNNSGSGSGTGNGSNNGTGTGTGTGGGTGGNSTNDNGNGGTGNNGGNGNGSGNNGSGSGSGNSGNGNGSGNGSGNNGNGNGNGSNDNNGNGLGNVLNLNDLTIGDNNGFGLGIPNIGNNGSGGGNGECTSNCSSDLDPYAGEISLTANGSAYSANLTSDGGNIELAWVVANGAPIDSSVTSCTAKSSKGDWIGAKSPTGGPDTLAIGANTTGSVISNTYTLDCTGIGEAAVTVNIAPVNGDGSTGILDGSLDLTVDNSAVALVDAAGGSVNLNWAVQIPPTASTTSCVASSSANDWTGAKSSAGGTDTVTIPANTSTSTESQSYTMNCSGIGSETVIVNTNISADAFADKTPSFTFSANGGTTVSVSPGTPVELDWTVQNINANSCFATSDGSYAGWGTQYAVVPNSLSATDQANLTKYTAQLTADQNQLSILTSTSTNQTETLGQLQGQIESDKTDLTQTLNNIDTANTDINLTTTTLQTASTTVAKIIYQLDEYNLENQDNTANNFQDLQITGNTLDTGSSTGSGSGSGNNNQNNNSDFQANNDAVITLQTQLDTASSTKNTLLNQLQDQKTTLTQLQNQKTTLQGQLETLQGQYAQEQTDTQINQDVSVATQIEDLQYNIQTLQGEIAAINAKITGQNLVLESQDKTTKEPSSDVGPDAQSFSEIAGLENVVVTGTYNGKNISGGDGSGGGIIGDVPITTNRIYTLTCTGDDGTVLTPQTVTINIDNSQGNSNQASTDPALTFLANGSTTANVNVGDPVTLTWQVANIPANSCRATSDGSYSGWGATYQKVKNIRTANGTIITNTAGYVIKPGDFVFYTNTLIPDPGGTLKAPTSDVGTNSQTFTETIGSDSSITATRTYTLTCGNIPPQTVTIDVANNPSVTLLVDGQSSEDVATGTSAVLQWTVQNIKGGSCMGTSTGNPDPGQNGGNFDGWGAEYETVTSGTYSSTSDSNGKTNEPISELVAVSGGTQKDPSTDVGSVAQIFTETIGQDGSITGAPRSYTITCTGLDGSTQTQTVDINGPSTGNNDGGSATNNPCAGDLDIDMAKTNLQNFITTYKQITGNDINTSIDPTVDVSPINFDSNGDPTDITHDSSASDSLDSCVTDVTNPSKANYQGPLNRIAYSTDYFDVTNPNNTADLPSAISTLPLMGSFLPDWVWVDQDSVLHPEHDGPKYAGATWTWDDQTGIATACLNGGTPGPGTPTCTPGDSNFVSNGIYVGDLVDLAHIAYQGEATSPATAGEGNGYNGDCLTNHACLYTHLDDDTASSSDNGYVGRAWTANGTKDNFNDIYTDSNDKQQILGLGLCFGIKVGYGKGSGGYPLVDANDNSAGGNQGLGVALTPYPNTFNGPWNEANISSVITAPTLNYGAVYIGDGGTCNNIAVVYVNNELGMFGEGIGDKIEQSGSFY